MRRILISGVILFIVSFFSYRVSYAFFTDSETAELTFKTAEEFEDGDEGAGQIASHLVISEVQIATEGASTTDFIEIYNPTNDAVDLSDFKLTKRNSSGTENSIASFDSGDVIAAHGYFLWANDDEGFAEQIGADEQTGSSISSDNSIALVKEDGDEEIVIDAVGWGTQSGVSFAEVSAFAENPSDGMSIERKAVVGSTQTSMAAGGADELRGNGYDSDDNSVDFVLRNISEPQNSTGAIETL